MTFGSLKLGDKVIGPNGTWKERTGTLIATITRERATQSRSTRSQKGEVCAIHSELKGHTCRRAPRRHHPPLPVQGRGAAAHPAQADAQPFVAPARAKHYFVPQIDTKIKVSPPFRLRLRRHGTLHRSPDEAGNAAVLHRPGRLIYTVYFRHNENVDAGSPLIGVCPRISSIRRVVLKVRPNGVSRNNMGKLLQIRVSAWTYRSEEDVSSGHGPL